MGKVQVHRDPATGVITQKVANAPLVRITPNVRFDIEAPATVDMRSGTIVFDGGAPGTHLPVRIELKGDQPRLVIDTADRSVAVSLQSGSVIR